MLSDLDITPVTNWADQGGLVSLMWHFNVPKTESTTLGTDGSGVTCTPSETSFKAANVFTAGSWENKWFYQEMDKVVEVLQKLQDAGVVAIWRPFHEAAGNACLKSLAPNLYQVSILYPYIAYGSDSISIIGSSESPL